MSAGMDGTECPVIVDGNWTADQSRTMKNKLELYFGNRKKSGGGDCRVETEHGAPRAAVYFRSEEVRERVLAKTKHEIILENQTVELRLTSASSSTSSNTSALKTVRSEAAAGNGASAENKDENVQSMAAVLENVDANMPRDLLSMLVENISSLEHGDYVMEIIWEMKKAVIIFNSHADVEKFLTRSRSSEKLQRHGLQARPLEAAESVRVENLPTAVVKEMLDLYFEKHWVLPDGVIMIPEEQAAIVSFSDPRVVRKICVKQNYVMGSIPMKVYPYYESLSCALYGLERPAWKMPEPFTERFHQVVRKFVLMKKLSQSINDQMRPYFCSVDLDNPEVKLSPLPSFLRQKGLTEKQVGMWMSTAQEAFQRVMSEYTAFECTADAPAWKAAEKDVRSVVGEDATLVLDASRAVLTVAGRGDFMKQIRAPVENIVLKAMDQIKRQMEAITEIMVLSPAMFFILNQDGLQKAALDISPDMSLSYDESAQKLIITGLPAEVFQTKTWILERNVGMSKKRIDVPLGLLDFLKTVDAMDMSLDLFTSKGTSAIYSIESKGVLLLGSSDRALADAESKMRTAFSHQILDVEDMEVLKLSSWVDLNQSLLDTYNSLKRKTVAIHVDPERMDKIIVAGFMNPVKEVSRGVKEFLVNNAQVKETIRVQSCAVVHFIEKKKTQDWSSIAKDNNVTVQFDEERPKIIIAGPRLNVGKAKSCFHTLTSALSTDTLVVDKPGAKKYFLSQGSLFLSTIMSEFKCAVVLRQENQDEEEEEEENFDRENILSVICYCKVTSSSGVLVSVSKADICSFRADAIVNAANEELKHIGGLALALLRAAGPELQKVSNDYTARYGKLKTSEAVVTDAFNLPSKYVIHAVGPRFSDSDRKTSVSRLRLVVKESLRQAEKKKCSTIALPAISSGVFGFPVDICAETIAQAVREYCDSPSNPGPLTEIHLVDNNDNTVRILAAAVNREFSDLGPTMTVPQQAAGKGAGASGYQGGRGQTKFGKHSGPESPGRKGNKGGQSPRQCGQGGLRMMEQTTSEGLKIVLCKGNIQDQPTDVIINTISEQMNLNQGAVSNAILQAAGAGLQAAVWSQVKTNTLKYGDVVITDGFGLRCRKVFHAVCPFWDSKNSQAKDDLISIIRYCMEEAEKRQMKSLAFPAIGTGNLSFPRQLVSGVMLKEIHSYSRRRTPRHLKEVVIVVHPSDSQSVECFTREFGGQAPQRNFQHEAAHEFHQLPVRNSQSQSQQPSASSFSQVSSPSLGVYRMHMGQLTLEVSSGDITKEACDAIVNSSNQNFTLKQGVSKAILEGAGPTVETECARIVNSQSYQPSLMILTSAGLLPSKNIIHIFGQKEPAKIKNIVYSVLKVCEENQFSSVAFPALGTGQGRTNPSEVAEAMVEAVVDFVRKKHSRFVCSVKILIFQTFMMNEFHKSMKKREGEEEKGLFTKIKDSFTSLFRSGEEQISSNDDWLILEGEEFEATVFQLCADNVRAVNQAKTRIKEAIVSEHMERTISDPYISQMSQADVAELKALQRKLTVSIHLNNGTEDQDPNIRLEGLTRDVFTAESAVRDIIRKVERKENLMNKAMQMSRLVKWQYQDYTGQTMTFDIHTNLNLEEALEKKQNTMIRIDNVKYTADVVRRNAFSPTGNKLVELHRKDLKDGAALPSHWDDMKGSLLERITVAVGSQEYVNVETQMQSTGLTATIIKIERIQNKILWQNYLLMKNQLDVKNNHTNNERTLFHGTGAAAIDRINKQGFNRSYAGQHAAMYGNGSYFAVDPVYSARGYAKPDINGHKCMYMAKVLVGDFTQGRQGMITPPAKSKGNTADLYDSVTDNMTAPSMFIVFNDIQAYPEYLITFT